MPRTGPTRFRPPYGALTPQMPAAPDERPSTLTLWDVASRDWSSPGPERIAATVLHSARPGSVSSCARAATGGQEVGELALPFGQAALSR